MRTLEQIYYDINKEEEMAKTWKDRLAKEEKKLNKKVDKLAAFIEDDGVFDALKESDRDLLMAQHATMVAYLNILTIRMKKHKLMPTEKSMKSIEEAVNIFDEISLEIDEIKEEEDGRNS